MSKYNISYSKNIVKNLIIINISKNSGYTTKMNNDVVSHLFKIVEMFPTKNFEIKLEGIK